MCGGHHHQSTTAGSESVDFFTNYGNYMPRVHCLQTENGQPDWLWIGILLALHVLILFGYTKIFLFWRRCYVAVPPNDREKKLWSLALLFLTCAVCGYGMSMLMFVWPAYRLLAIFLSVLVIATWRFAWYLKPFEDTFAAQSKLREGRRAAESANLAKSDFLANMSHEIRTPMTAILGFTETLLDSSQTETDRINCIHTIQRNGEHLLGLINDILDLSKIEAGKMDVELTDVDPCQVIADVLSLMQVRAEAKSLYLNAEFDGAVPATVRTDATRLRQILINLVGNAIKFTEIGGVRIVTKLATSSTGKLNIKFDIVDSGCGITQEQRERLFQPFSQADMSTTRNFGGTGLGLTISRRFANLLEGDIEITASVPGKGSTFSVTLAASKTDELELETNPARRVARLQADHRKPNQPVDCQHLDGKRVLLVEDGRDNQRLISFVLKKAGVSVAVAENGQIGMEMALTAMDEQQPFDVILMDMQMPVLDGYSATRKLREAGYARPIIALTAHAMQSDRQKCLDAGCDEFTTKPINKSELIALVQVFAANQAESLSDLSQPSGALIDPCTRN